MQIRPLYDRVLIRRIEEEQMTAGGLFLPDKAKEKPLIGIIIAVGQGRLHEDGQLHDLAVKEGDKVVFGQYAGVEIKVAGEDRMVLREDEILGILED